jgi:hypothetical protein
MRESKKTICNIFPANVQLFVTGRSKKCRVCEYEHLARGFCQYHYDNMRRGKDKEVFSAAVILLNYSTSSK